MIPKVIHYCWFGRGKMPDLAIKCVESWKKFFPDYELKLWNEDNFNIDISPFVRQAYDARKYAFVSDYARLWIIYNYGGLYFDTDVEVVASMENILATPFMGVETSASDARGVCVNPGLGIAAEKGNIVYSDLLEIYDNLNFNKYIDNLNKISVVAITTEYFNRHGLQQVDEIQQVRGITIYPKSYLCPIDQNGHVLNLRPETVSIHHYAASWIDGTGKLKKLLRSVLGASLTLWLIRLKRAIMGVKGNN